MNSQLCYAILAANSVNNWCYTFFAHRWYKITRLLTKHDCLNRICWLTLFAIIWQKKTSKAKPKSWSAITRLWGWRHVWIASRPRKYAAKGFNRGVMFNQVDFAFPFLNNWRRILMMATKNSVRRRSKNAPSRIYCWLYGFQLFDSFTHGLRFFGS